MQSRRAKLLIRAIEFLAAGLCAAILWIGFGPAPAKTQKQHASLSFLQGLLEKAGLIALEQEACPETRVLASEPKETPVTDFCSLPLDKTPQENNNK